MTAPVGSDALDRITEPGEVTGEVDHLLRAAVEPARAAAVADAGPGQVGTYLGCQLVEGGGTDSGPVAVHLFACTVPAYSGWAWSVSVTRVPGEDDVTVDEVVLQPGAGALLPPPWVPWNERLRPEDLGPADVLPAEPDDARLVPAYTLSGDPALDDLAFELGIGRVRVMSRGGRIDAAERWNDGPTGPDTPTAKQAPAECGTCGFYLPLEGSLGVMLGACGNEYAPSDGRVVAVAFGCGAHSESPQPVSEPLGAIHHNTEGYDDLDLGPRRPVGEVTPADAPSADEAPVEEDASEDPSPDDESAAEGDPALEPPAPAETPVPVIGRDDNEPDHG